MRDQKVLPKQDDPARQSEEPDDQDRLQTMRMVAHRKIHRSAREESDGGSSVGLAYADDEAEQRRGDDVEVQAPPKPENPAKIKCVGLEKEAKALNPEPRDGTAWNRLNEIQGEAYQCMRDCGMESDDGQECRQIAEQIGQQIAERETPFLSELDLLIDDFAEKVNNMESPGWWQPEILESLDDNIMKGYLCHPQMGIQAPYGIRSAFGSKPGLSMRMQRMDALRQKLEKGDRKSGELKEAEGKANAAELRELSAKHKALNSVRGLIIGWGCNEIGNLVGKIRDLGCMGNAVGNALENTIGYLGDERYEKYEAALARAAEDPDSVTAEEKADVQMALSKVQYFEPLSALTSSGFQTSLLKAIGMAAKQSGLSLDPREGFKAVGKSFEAGLDPKEDDGKERDEMGMQDFARMLAEGGDAAAALAETLGTNVGLLQELCRGAASEWIGTLLDTTAAVSFWGKAAVMTLDLLGWGSAAAASDAADSKLEEEQNNQADIETYMGGVDHAYDYKYMTKTGATAVMTIGGRKPL